MTLTLQEQRSIISTSEKPWWHWHCQSEDRCNLTNLIYISQRTTLEILSYLWCFFFLQHLEVLSPQRFFTFVRLVPRVLSGAVLSPITAACDWVHLMPLAHQGERACPAGQWSGLTMFVLFFFFLPSLVSFVMERRRVHGATASLIQVLLLFIFYFHSPHPLFGDVRVRGPSKWVLQ